MKKKTFLVVLLTFLISLSIFACGKVSPLGEYTDFNGVNNAYIMSIDENMTIDGVLDEDVWTNSKNKLTAENTANGKKMDVYTYLGENGVYFAFDVKDNALFYNSGRRQSRNSGVEVYLTTLDHFALEKGCVSVRLAPTGEGNEVAIEYYRPNAAGNEWTSTKAKGKYLGAAVINGTMNSEAKDSEGYTAELAVSWELLGVESADVIQYTASFVQALGYDDDVREANTFFAGTTHTGVGSWKAVSNDGYIEDKYSYVDENTAVYDDFMNIDGVLDEEEWTEFISAGKGKTFTHNSTGISLTINTLMTDKGLYIGLDSSDNDVYYSEDRAVKFNTGVELFVAGNGTTTLNEENVIQIRYNVGGPGDRYQVNLNSEYPYKSNYFPARIAGSVKNGVMNSSETDGWQGEIFLPWSSIGVTEDNMKNQAAVLACIYHCESATATSSPEWQYISVTGGDVYGNNSHNVNPQQSFFLFTKDSGFIPNGISVSEVALSKADLNSDGTAYEHIVTVSSSDAITLSGFTTEKPAVIGAIFDFGEAENVSVTDRSDGTYIISIPEEDISYFDNPRKVTVTANGADAQFNVSFDGNFTLDGILDDNVYNGLNHIVTKAASGIGNVESDFVFALNQKAMYVGIEIKDALVNTDTQWGSGVEMYFNFGATLSSANTYQVRLYADESARYYVYMDEAAENGFSWKEDSSLVPEISIVSNITGDGYIIEARIPWSLFGLETAPENCGIAALTKFATNENKSSFSVRYDKLDLGNEGSRVIENYLNFDETGFAPEKIYASDVVFVKGMDVAAGNYSAEFNAYYVSGGAIAVTEGVAADDYTGAVTNMTDGTYSFTLPQSVVEAIDENKLFNISAGTASGQINVVYIEPSAEDFDDSKILSYVNFDEGLDSLKGFDASMRRGEAEYGAMSGSYSTNRYYTLDMKNRALKLDNATVGTKSFTVSMMINGDDIKNCQYTASNGYALILFGTGNVDGSEGFSVRVRYDSTGAKPNAFQIKVLDQNDGGGTASVINAIDGWQRWTVVFDRSVTDTLTVSVYIDAKLIYTKQFALASDVSLDGAVGSVFGIGAGGVDDGNAQGANYLSNKVGIDDFMLYDGIMTQNDMYNFVQYVGEINLANAFRMDDIAFDFSDVDTDGFSTQFVVNAYLADGSVISLDDTQVTFGEEIADFITHMGEGDTGYFLFSVGVDDLSIFKAGLTSIYTYNGITKQVRISYTPLEKIYLDSEEFEFWANDKTGDNYVFTVGVYADQSLSTPIAENVQFGDWTDYATANGDGTYTFNVPAAVFEALTYEKVVSVTVADAEAAEFTVTRKVLSDDQLNGIFASLEAYYDFDENLTDYVGNHETAPVRGESASYSDREGSYSGDKALNINTVNNTVGIENLLLGTDSFTISLDVKLDSASYAGSNAAYEIVTSTKNNDSDPCTFQLSAHGGQNRLRIQLGRNDQGFYFEGSTGKLKIDQWQRYTLVVTRGVEFDPEHTMTNSKYDAQGNPVSSSSPAAPYVTPERITVALYLDGEYIETKSFWFTEGQSLGTGIVYLGGNLAWDNKSAVVDNFMFIRKALTDYEVEGLDNYYGDIVAKYGWTAGDKVISYTDVVENETYVTTLDITKLHNEAVITGASFDGLPAGATVSEDNGVYTVSISYDSLEAFVGGKTVSVTINGVTKEFTISYAPLNQLYLDTDAITLYTTDKTGDNYEFTVGVYADSELSVPVTGVTFSPFTASDNGDGTYSFVVPATQMESAASHQITATKVVTDGASIGSSFTVNYISWTVADVAEKTEIYLNFDGSLINYAGSGVANTNGAVYAADDDYTGDQAYVANMQKRASKVEAVLGTDSFVISTMINGADLKNLAGDGYATAIVATGNIDGTNGFSIRMRADTYQIKVLSDRDAGGTDVVLAAISEDWQRWTFVFDRTVEGKLVVSTYVDGVLVYTSKEFNVAADVSLDVEGYGTIGIGAPGCKPDTDNYPASTNVDVRYDDFMFYRGYMNAKQVQAIDGYIESMKESTTFVAEDVLFDYNTPGIESGYTQDLVINKVYPQVTAITSDIEFDGVAADYISLSDGKYVLSIPAEDLDTFAVTEGVTVNYTYLGITKSFIIKYVKMGELYVDEIEIFDLELNADNQIVHNVRVSADAEGLVGVSGVDFGEINSYVTAGETAGDYLITLTAEQAAALPAEIEISASGVRKTVKVSYTESLINNVEALSLTGTQYENDTQGGKVFAGVELGTDSFTVSGTFGNISNCASGGGSALFSTANADFWDGVTCYVNPERIRFKFAGVQAGSSVDISGDFTKYNEWTNFVFHFDRSVSKSITITVYADGELVGTKTTVLNEDLTFDYGDSKNFVLGGYNLEAKGQTSSFTGAAPVDANSFGLTSAAFAVTKGIVPVDIAEAYLNGAVQSYSIDVSSVKADFGFNDGTTANSVSESGVAMELNAAAASSVVAGREGGEDKAIQINSTSMYYDVNGFDPGVNSFTVSMWLKMDFTTALNANGSGIVLFATTDPASASGFAASIRQNTIRMRMNGTTNFMTVKNTDRYTDKWTNFTFSFTRGAGKCVVNVYVNFALAATSTVTVDDAVSLSNPEKTSFIGIGRGVEVAVSTGGDYENGVFKWYEDNTHTVDDIVLIDSALDASEILGLMNYFKA